MPFTIHLRREVAAPADTVWKVVSDLDAYGEWNPFVVRCRSTLEPGSPIVMQVRLFSFTQSQRETVFEATPPLRLCYGIAKGPVRSRRCHEIKALTAARSEYVSHFQLDGPLAPLVRLLLGSRLEQGFRSMTDALVRRAESLAPPESSSR